MKRNNKDSISIFYFWNFHLALINTIFYLPKKTKTDMTKEPFCKIVTLMHAL